MFRQFQASCLVLLFLVGFAQQTLKPQNRKVDCNKGVTGTIYEYGALTLNGEEYIQFKQFAGKHVLFVNVCPGKNSRFNSFGKLNALQEELKNFGVIVLAFPCNQFGKQEPGTNSEIFVGLKYVRPGSGFLFEKGDVNGEKEQKVFTFLKNSCPPTSDLLGSSSQLFWEPMKVHDIRWNFEKFLVGPDGVPVMAPVSTVKSDILEYLKQFNTH
uniref:Glutathione peroxidase n=1 Tax=Gorilla gorilla gorilla TaxID=9595 RepID=A0A2I2YPW2_GORGO